MAQESPEARITPEQIKAEIAERFSRELTACQELHDAYVERCDPWSGRAMEGERDSETLGADEIICLEMSRSAKTFLAVMELCIEGYGDQAAMLNRSMFEGMAVAHWAHANEELAVLNFKRASRLHERLTAERFRNTEWEEADSLEPLPIDADELKELHKDFGAYGQFLWTGHRSLETLMPDIEDQWVTEESRRELWNYFRIAHHDNNQLLHSTVSGLVRGIGGRDEEGVSFYSGPSSRWIAQALFSGYFSFVNLFTLIFDRFGLADREPFDDMVREHSFEFVTFTRETTKDVGRNDPCPCGSGRKFKKCHEAQVRASAT